MHYIVAPTHIRAEYFSAALGLARTQWRALSGSSVNSPVGASGTFHILPGVSDEVASRANFNASTTPGSTVIDHRR